ncbi:MAG: RNA polymerase sigma factor [Chloroflexota bacterium]|nr:RNA polymerase sigma factor [Chloroflexota bacterium]
MEGQPLEEREIVERAQQGDTGAYETLVRQYQDVAFRTAYLITGTAAEAEEAAQEAFVKAWAALNRFRLDAPFRPWLLRIVANEARNRRKAVGRRVGLALRATERHRNDDVAPSPETMALRAEQQDALLRAINQLREDDRLVIAYRYFFDLSEAEMATALAVARGTVKSRLSRALGRLRTALRADGITDGDLGGLENG